MNGYKVHHSLFAVFVMIASLWLNEFQLKAFAIGLGIFTSHGIEEMYFNKIPFPKSFLIYITKIKEQK